MPCRHEDDGEHVFVTPWRNSTQEDKPDPDVTRLIQEVNRLRWLLGELLGNATIDSEPYQNGANPDNANPDNAHPECPTGHNRLKSEADYLTSTICKYLKSTYKKGVYSKEVDDWWAEHKIKDALRAEKKEAEQRLTDALAEVDRLNALLQND